MKELEAKRSEIDSQLSLSKDVGAFFQEQEAVLRRVVEEMGRQREQVVQDARDKVTTIEKGVSDLVKKECERRVDTTLRQMVKEESDAAKAKLQSLKAL